MKIIDIKGSTGNSTILIGESVENLGKYLPTEKAVIITDSNVRRYYGEKFPPCDIIEIGQGEKIKNLETVHEIYEKLLTLEIDRSDFIVGIGGGIVCDIAGFAASTYMRGLRFGFVSSTLLSQVDASVGGKNGVNLGGYKNIVGVFNQPEFVICDLSLLRSLPEKEILCGLAEVVKHGAIADPSLFSYIEENYEKILALDISAMERLVYDSVVIKSNVVNQDEKESGERKKLNFGHTFGHAIEKVAALPHGEAVSIGMVAAGRLSVKRGLLSSTDEKRLERILARLGLPAGLDNDMSKVLDALKKDKKRKGENIDFVFLGNIGNAVVESIPIKELEDFIREEDEGDRTSQIY